MTAPTAEQQVEFLWNLQRLLGEGNFVATYKHALLLALADICVEHGDDTGAPLTVSVPMIAEKMVSYYWRQAKPYPASLGGGALLRQNTGKQAKIVLLVAAALQSSAGSYAIARARGRFWRQLVANVATIVKKMPLWKLQRVGEEILDFLYPSIGCGHVIELRPGVAFCFRRFHGLVEDLVRGAWLRLVRGINGATIGPVANLDEFLFGSEREDLSKYQPILSRIQRDGCFYCKRHLDSTVVDHFIPWSRYPIDMGHNFVLAHKSCNEEKRDRIAAVEHLKKWCQRNEDHAEYLEREFCSRGLYADRKASTKVTCWAYEQVEASKGLVWEKEANLVPLLGDWRKIPGLAV